jgi:hypothetical protein
MCTVDDWSLPRSKFTVPKCHLLYPTRRCMYRFWVRNIDQFASEPNNNKDGTAPLLLMRTLSYLLSLYDHTIVSYQRGCRVQNHRH